MRRNAADLGDPEFDVADVDANTLLAQAGWVHARAIRASASQDNAEGPIADDEAEPTLALDPERLAPWHVPAALRAQPERTSDRSWAAAFTALVEPLDAEPASERADNTNAEDISHTAPVHPHARREWEEAAAELQAMQSRESDTPSFAELAPHDADKQSNRRSSPTAAPDRSQTADARVPSRDRVTAAPLLQRSAARSALSRWLPPADIRHWLWMAAGGVAVVAAQFSLQAMSTETPSVPVQGTPVPAVQTGLRITTRPPGAAVSIDGKPTGKTTPVLLRQLAPGLHSVELTRAGYFDSSFPVALEAAVITQLPELELRPLTAASAPIDESDTETADTPLAPTRVRSRAAASAAAEQGEGVLQISSQPWSLVIVDDQVVGTTPQRAIRLRAGKHVVRLVNDALQMSKRIKVQIREGQTLKTFVNL